MNRRNFIKQLAAAGLCASQPFIAPFSRAELTPYRGKFFVCISADGGWDVTSLCDPKADPAINNWGKTQTIQTLSGSPITFAPFAYNTQFFNDHHAKMLVINGIDSQTNAHEAGVRNTWSGQLGHGYPSFAALAASILGPNLPLSYISNGGYKETAGLTQYTLMQDPSTLKKLVFPNAFVDYDPQGSWDAPKQYHRNEAMALIQAAKSQRLNRLLAKDDINPKQLNSLRNMFNARIGADQLAPLAQTLPENLVSNLDEDGQWNPLMRQAQMALAAYEAGLTVAADLTMWGFDTHDDHDNEHATALQRLQRGINYLWAEAERRGIDDKLVVLVSSDFGRTPIYNDGDGKDHWPISSSIIMAKNQAWGNRVVGTTTDGHEAVSINANTLASDVNGITLHPKHIQQAMRQLAGIADHEFCQRFRLTDDTINFFAV